MNRKRGKRNQKEKEEGEEVGGNGTPSDSEVVNISFKAKEERIKNEFP